jgi:hypothetical protein
MARGRFGIDGRQACGGKVVGVTWGEFVEGAGVARLCAGVGFGGV